MTEEIQIGKIYKRKPLDNYSMIGVYPKYMVLTGIREVTKEKQKIYMFVDVEGESNSDISMTDNIVQWYYQLME